MARAGRVQRSDARSSFLGRRLAASVVAANLFVVGLVAASLDQSRDHFRAEATVVGQNLARLLETAIGASFDQVDLALLTAADEHLRQARTGSIDAARAVAEELPRRIPGHRVLFVSGYAGDGSMDRGVTEDPLQFLAKPFTASALLIRVRQVLDAPAPVAVRT